MSWDKKRERFSHKQCFFCTILVEDGAYRFIQCLIACSIWKYLSEIWHVLTGYYLVPTQWVFVQYVQNGPRDEREIIFQFLRYGGLQHNWNMRNAFLFDGRHGVNEYVRKLKCVLLWHFWVLAHVGIVSSSAYSNLLMAVENVPLS